MKKILLIILVILFGCSDEQNETPKIEKEPPIEVIKGGADAMYGVYFESFQAQLESTDPFIFGTVLSVEENNQFVDSIYIEVIHSTQNLDKEIIRLSDFKNSGRYIVGNQYLLHVTYSGIPSDYYSLVAGEQSYYPLKDNVFIIPYDFNTEVSTDLRNKNELIKLIFGIK